MQLTRNKLQKDSYPQLLKEFNPEMYSDLIFASDVLNKCDWNLDTAKERTGKIIALKARLSTPVHPAVPFNFTNSLINNLLDYNTNIEIIMTVFKKMETEFRLNQRQIDTIFKILEKLCDECISYECDIEYYIEER